MELGWESGVLVITISVWLDIILSYAIPFALSYMLIGCVWTEAAVKTVVGLSALVAAVVFIGRFVLALYIYGGIIG